MSDNQEEFNALRKAAYQFVNEHGKDPDRLRGFSETFMRQWRDERGPQMHDDRRLVDDIVRWTVNRYNPPRYRPKRSREERAAVFLMAPAAYEMSGEDFGRVSIRNAARITGQSKSTVGRHLLRQGIAPRREIKIRQLSPIGQRLVRILDETFDRRAAGIVQLDRLGSALWDGAVSRPVPKTTQASRRKKLRILFREVSSAKLGYSIVAVDDVCGIHRGRRFPSLSEAATWIAEEMRLNRYAPIRLPSRDPAHVRSYFWGDPIVKDVMSIIDMAVTGQFYPIEKLEAIFRFERLLIDPTPMLPWLERAYHSFAGDDMAENLMGLSSMIVDTGVRKAVRRLGRIMSDLKGFMGSFPPCYDAFLTVDHVLGIMDKTAEASPESFARLAYIRDMFEHWGEQVDAGEQLPRMLDLEKSGEWVAPDADVIAAYLPTETSEIGSGNEKNQYFVK